VRQISVWVSHRRILQLRCVQGGIKVGATEAIAPGLPMQGHPRDEIYLFQMKYSFEKFS